MDQIQKPSKMSELLQTSMDKIKELVDSNTVVGEPITTEDGMTLIPVSRVSFGFGTGGSDLPTKNGTGFGGGSGAGVRIDPIGFLIVKDGTVRMVNIMPPPATSIDRVLDMLPNVIDKIEVMVEKHNASKE